MLSENFHTCKLTVDLKTASKEQYASRLNNKRILSNFEQVSEDLHIQGQFSILISLVFKVMISFFNILWSYKKYSMIRSQRAALVHKPPLMATWDKTAALTCLQKWYGN